MDTGEPKKCPFCGATIRLCAGFFKDAEYYIHLGMDNTKGDFCILSGFRFRPEHMHLWDKRVNVGGED